MPNNRQTSQLLDMERHEKDEKIIQSLMQLVRQLLWTIGVLLIALLGVTALAVWQPDVAAWFKPSPKPETPVFYSSGSSANEDDGYWHAPEVDTIADARRKKQIEYGKELIAHTAKYLGPKGSVAQLSNGMNCQNCHLQAGTAVYGNNYGSVASMYPKFRARSGTVEDVYKRVNDCFERSLNGRALDSMSVEMQAIKSYLLFVGSNVAKGKRAEGSGFKDMAYLGRAADPEKGKTVYIEKCQVCHMDQGQGLMALEGNEYTYPPLWGPHSYNDGAGLYRLGNFAKYVKYNMPFGATHNNTQLSDEEAWDVAAFANSQPRPHKVGKGDWPDISKKPIDSPFGPYADQFPEKQHKFGPFQPIADFYKK